MRSAADLAQLREAIAEVDRELVALLARRRALARAIGRAKASAGLPVLDPAREVEVVRRAAAWARELGADEEWVRALFWQIVAGCRRAQREGEACAPPSGASA